MILVWEKLLSQLHLSMFWSLSTGTKDHWICQVAPASEKSLGSIQGADCPAGQSRWDECWGPHTNMGRGGPPRFLTASQPSAPVWGSHWDRKPGGEIQKFWANASCSERPRREIHLVQIPGSHPQRCWFLRSAKGVGPLIDSGSQIESEMQPGLVPAYLVPLGFLLWYPGSNAHLPPWNLITATEGDSSAPHPWAGKML